MTTLAQALDAATRPVPTVELEDWRYSRVAAVPTTLRVDADGRAASAPVLRGDPVDAFDEVGDTWRQAPRVVEVAAGADGGVVTVTVPAPAPGTVSFPHLVVDAGEDSQVTVVVDRASPDVEAVVFPLVEVRAGAAARVRLVEVQRLGPRVWQLGRLVACGDADSRLDLGVVALGGHYARLAVTVRSRGKGAHTALSALSFGEGDQMHDFRVLQDHLAAKTTSDLLFKAAVEDRARAIYTGLIHIAKDAPGCRAFQTNRNVVLSDGAWAESVPNLEIENNDVQCSHASAVGPVDTDQRFYLESRGVPPWVAERLIVLGFFDDVLDRLDLGETTASLHAELVAKLDRRRDG